MIPTHHDLPVELAHLVGLVGQRLLVLHLVLQHADLGLLVELVVDLLKFGDLIFWKFTGFLENL